MKITTVKKFTLGKIKDTPVLIYRNFKPFEKLSDGVVFQVKDDGVVRLSFWQGKKCLSLYDFKLKTPEGKVVLVSAPLLRVEVRGKNSDGVVAIAININNLQPTEKSRVSKYEVY